MEEKLKPCPFCGSTDLCDGYTAKMRYIACFECSAEGPLEKTKKQAIDAWNKRS